MKTTPGRPMIQLAAVAVIGLFGVTACESQPSAQRVAKDLIDTLADTDEERVCMRAEIDLYGKDELEQIGEDALSDDETVSSVAEAELAKLQDALEACQD